MLQLGERGCLKLVSLISILTIKLIPQIPQHPKYRSTVTLAVMDQAAKDFGYTKEEFVEAVEIYEHFGNVNLEDVTAPSLQD